jgi:leucyl aminopeptidase
VKALESLGLEVEILGEPEMMKLGMGSLLGVGQGSIRESQLAVIKWNGAADKSAQPIAFIGKGVCFDTGGISIKPADGHGRHEVGHGRGRRSCGPDARARGPQGQGQRRRHPGAR